MRNIMRKLRILPVLFTVMVAVLFGVSGVASASVGNHGYGDQRVWNFYDRDGRHHDWRHHDWRQHKHDKCDRDGRHHDGRHHKHDKCDNDKRDKRDKRDHDKRDHDKRDHDKRDKRDHR